MRKLIAAINMTLDGYCDHTAMNAEDELHKHYNELVRNAHALLYGRITYQLMENYWPALVKTPTGNKTADEFALLIDDIHKIVFSRTMKNVRWKNTKLVTGEIKEEVSKLRKQEGKYILAGSPGLIAELTKLNLIDEYQLCVHPVISGKGLPLFKNIIDRKILKLINTKSFSSGKIVLYYEPAGND